MASPSPAERPLRDALLGLTKLDDHAEIDYSVVIDRYLGLTPEYRADPLPDIILEMCKQEYPLAAQPPLDALAVMATALAVPGKVIIGDDLNIDRIEIDFDRNIILIVRKDFWQLVAYGYTPERGVRGDVTGGPLNWFDAEGKQARRLLALLTASATKAASDG